MTLTVTPLDTSKSSEEQPSQSYSYRFTTVINNLRFINPAIMSKISELGIPSALHSLTTHSSDLISDTAIALCETYLFG